MHVEGCEHLGHGSAGKFDIAGEPGVYIHINNFSPMGLGGDEPLGEGALGHAHHAPGLSQQLHQGGDVVGPHVQHGAASPLVVELRVRVPGLVAVAYHGAASSHDITDHAAVNEPPGGLDARAHEGVRRAAQAQPFFLRQGNELAGLVHIHTQRLLAVHMLAVEKSLLRHLKMLIGTGQVEDNLYLRVIECLIHVFIDFGLGSLSPFLDLALHIGRALFRSFGNKVAYPHQLHFPEGMGDVLQIDAADGAYTDHRHFYWLPVFHDESSFHLHNIFCAL